MRRQHRRHWQPGLRHAGRQRVKRRQKGISRARSRGDGENIYHSGAVYIGTGVVSVGRLVMADLGFRGGNLSILVFIARCLIIGFGASFALKRQI